MTTRFNSADNLTWEPVVDSTDFQKALDEEEYVASVVDETLKVRHKPTDPEYAGKVAGPMGQVGLYIHTMEDDEWIYVAHMIRQVEYQCLLFRHRKLFPHHRKEKVSA